MSDLKQPRDHGEGIVGPRPETAAGGPVPSPELRYFVEIQRLAYYGGLVPPHRESWQPYGASPSWPALLAFVGVLRRTYPDMPIRVSTNRRDH